MTGKKELKRLAYENACCRCQYYENEKCNNKDTCVWKQIIQDLERLEKLENKIEQEFLTLQKRQEELQGCMFDYECYMEFNINKKKIDLLLKLKKEVFNNGK